MSTLKQFCLLGTAVLIIAACSKDSDQGGQDDPTKKELPADPGPKYSDVTVEDEATTEDNVANTTFDDSLTITFSGTSATVSGSITDVTVSTSGAGVTATNSGNKKVKYILTGSSSDGFFKLYSPNKKQAIVLQNLSLTNQSGAAINNQSKKRTFIVIEGTNFIKDGEVNASGKYPSETQTPDEDMKAALFSEGQLAFSGTGKLIVEAIGKAGITSDDYVRFFTGSDVTVTSSKGHGVRGKDAVIITGGTVNVTLANTATGKKCFTTDSLMYMGGGSATLVNNASAGIIEEELTGAAGIKADKTFVIRGGTLNVTATGKGCKCINGDDAGFFEGGTVTAKATGENYGSQGRPGEEDNSVPSKAIKFDGNIEFSGSTVTASAEHHEAIEAKGTIYVSGGTISATSSDDAINCGSTMNIAKGVIYARSTGNDGIDANGNCVIRGGTVYAIGSGTPEVGIDANTEGGYKLYIQDANVISIAGIENNSVVNQAVISTSWNRNATYSLCNSDNALFTFQAPSSGGQGIFISAPSLVSGSTYALKTGATVSGAEAYFDGILSIGGTASGGNSTSVTASNYSSGGGGGGGGPVAPRAL